MIITQDEFALRNWYSKKDIIYMEKSKREDENTIK